MTIYENLLAELRSHGLFTPSGRISYKTKLPDDLIARCFEATAACTSPHFKDRLYWIIHGMTKYPVCASCSKTIMTPVKNMSSRLHLQAYCTAGCRLTSKDARESDAKSREAKTGFRHPMQNPEIKKKRGETNIEKYGFACSMQNADVKERRRLSNQRKYGVNSTLQVSEVQSKIKATLLSRYGVDNAMKAPWIRLKATATCLRRYGVPNPMQSFKIFQKHLRSRFKTKTLEFKGSKFLYQGYEDVVIKYLIDELKLDPKEIQVGRKTLPRIFYHNTKKPGNSRYYPDIYIKSQGLLIEVKSDYTLKLDTQVYNKQRACKKAGYNHLIVVCTKTKIIRTI